MTKTTQIQVRCNDTQKAAFKARAKQADLSVSELIIQSTLGEAPLVVPPPKPKVLKAAYPEAGEGSRGVELDNELGERDQWIKATARALVDENRGLSPTLAEKAATTQWERAHE
jgi:hypothetical protein